MRSKLIAQIARADKTKDMHKRLALYTAILNTPQTTEYLSAKEIGDIFYNRSLNHLEIGGSHFAKREYREAVADMRCADSDIRNAEIRYDQTTDKHACAQRMSEYRNTRFHIIDVKEGRADAAMTEFVKVSRLIITTPDKPVIYTANPVEEDGYRADNEALDARQFVPAKIAPFVPFAPLERLGFFELLEDLQMPVRPIMITQAFNIGPQKSNESELGFNPPAFFSKTAVLKRKLEKSNLRSEQAEKKLGVADSPQQQAI